MEMWKFEGPAGGTDYKNKGSCTEYKHALKTKHFWSKGNQMLWGGRHSL